MLVRKLSKHESNGRFYSGTKNGRQEFDYYTSHSLEISRKYPGKHIAIVGNRIAATGKDAMTVWKMAKKKFPRSNPTLAYIPKHDILIL